MSAGYWQGTGKHQGMVVFRKKIRLFRMSDRQGKRKGIPLDEAWTEHQEDVRDTTEGTSEVR